jgi:N-acetylneuraminate synthase/N,N'-diacetyllegionaminate synthase
MKIRDFDLDKEILIIAEIGNNHEGSYSLAEEMIGLAAKAGAGAVKFQSIIPDKLVSISQIERVRQLEKFCLNYSEIERLSKVAKQENILFLSTPFDLESAHCLNSLISAYKIASGDNNFFPLIDVIARTGKPILLSSGLADLKQISETKYFIQVIWDEMGIDQELAILHCVVNYPTAPANANLLAIRQLQKFNITVGYSDHTIGIEAAVLSAALGARIIEKHFTIAKDYSDFQDHQLSADPTDLSELVKRVKNVEELLGKEKTQTLECEEKFKLNVRRSIVAKEDLESGRVVKLEDLTWVRPGNGLSPGEEGKITGRSLRRSIRRGDIILPNDLK